MNAESHSAATLSRLLAADWAGKTSFDHRMSRGKLMQEYLRRASWWAQELDAVREWPFLDVAARMAPEIHVPQDLSDQLEALIHVRIRWPSVASMCRAALRWAVMLDVGVPVPHGLEDPYEPLLLMFERGGGFTTEHGFVDLVGLSVPRRTWQDHLVAKPFTLLDRATLDALDAA